MVNFELPQMKYPEQKGLISIIVPIYNTGNNLRECLDSILAQTYTNWEALLVNDGSTDGTGKIVDEYAKKDSRFIAIHKLNGGTLLARKTGLENAKGEFVANIDSDDKYHPRFLEKMHAKIIETDSDFVWCKYQYQSVDKSTSIRSSDYKWSINVSENLVPMTWSSRGISWVTWNKLVKREIYTKVGFPNMHLTLGEDPVQMLQVAYHSKSAAFVSENLYSYETGATAMNPKPISILISKLLIKKTLENLFDGIVPDNLKNAMTGLSYCYFLLDKKARVQFRDEIEPILPELIKVEKLDLRIFLLFASKGIEFPFKLRVSIGRMAKFIQRRLF